jgi:hypothetical protein
LAGPTGPNRISTFRAQPGSIASALFAPSRAQLQLPFSGPGPIASALAGPNASELVGPSRAQSHQRVSGLAGPNRTSGVRNPPGPIASARGRRSPAVGACRSGRQAFAKALPTEPRPLPGRWEGVAQGDGPWPKAGMQLAKCCQRRPGIPLPRATVGSASPTVGARLATAGFPSAVRPLAAPRLRLAGSHFLEIP